jgi:hypothetical protein
MARERGQPLLHRIVSAGDAVTSLRPTHPRVRLAVGIGVPVLVLGCLGLAIASQWSKLPHLKWHFEAGWLVLSLGAFAVFQYAQSELYVMMMHALGSPLKPVRGRAIWCVTLLGRYVPTSVMLAVSRMALAQREGVPKRVSFASFVYEMGLTFTAAVIVGAYFFVSLPSLRHDPERFLALALPVIALIALDPRVFHRLADVALHRLGREPLPLSLSRRRVLSFLVAYALAMVVAGFGVYAFARAVHPVAGSHLASVVASYSVGFAVSLLAFVLPGGLGAREAAMAAALSPAVGLTVGIAVAVAVRLEQMLVEVIFAGVAPLVARRATGREIAPAGPPPPAP